MEANGLIRAWGPSIISALVGGVTVIIIGAQRQAVTETDVANIRMEQRTQDQRISDIDSHGSREVVSMAGRLEAIQARDIEQDRRIGAFETTLAALSGRFIIVEDRLAACQGCHMGGGGKVLLDHLNKKQRGK
jgi:hypothetical protein